MTPYNRGHIAALEKLGMTEPPYYVKQVLQDLTGGREYNEDYVRGEMDEFFDAYKKNDSAEVEEELQDVMYGTQMLARQRAEKDHPLLGADDKVREFYRRNNYLDKLFKQEGVPFSTDYLTGGTNVKKPHKIQGAFNLAGHEISPEQAAQYSTDYEQFKG